jgi:hypothetical protein
MTFILALAVFLISSFIVLNPKIDDGVLVKTALTSTSFCSGAYIIGGDIHAFWYSMVGIIVAGIIFTSWRLYRELV